MSRSKVWGTVAALAAAGCVATAQGTVVNIFENVNPRSPGEQPAKVSDTKKILDVASSTSANVTLTLSASGNAQNKDQSVYLSFNGDQPASAWAPDGLNADLEFALDANSPSLLLGPLYAAAPSGTSTLFLANLDFGQQGGFEQWGLVTSAIPEPSTWMLTGLGGLALGMRLLRRRTGR